MRTTRTLGVMAAVALATPLASAQSTFPNVTTLPTTFQPANGFTEDFETAAGVVPAYMELHSYNQVTAVYNDPNNWCNIGQLAACGAPYGGSYCLEMGILPGSTTYQDVENAMIIGLNGAGASSLYLNFFAHNGGEETDPIDGVWISDDGVNWHEVGNSNPWSGVVPSGNLWLPVYNLDLMSTPASTAGDFYIMFGQDDNFPYLAPGAGFASDGIGIDDISVSTSQTPIPPPNPVNFTWVVLPTSFTNVAGGYFEDFEAGAGTLAANMAVTEIDSVTFLPNTNASANVGQNGAFATTSYSGSYHLEMAAVVSNSGNNPLNALTLGLNGAGAANLDMLSFQLLENFDELGGFDGVWISDNGTDWTIVHDGQGSSSWALESGIDMTFQGQNPVNLSGDFYLMFSQSDNSSWTGGDGNAYDDIRIGAIPPPPPVLALNGVCGVAPSSLDVSGATANSPVALLYGFGSGSAVAPAASPYCAGTVTGLDSINLYDWMASDANGDASFTTPAGLIPAAACGLATVQAVDIATCMMTNTVAL